MEITPLKTPGIIDCHNHSRSFSPDSSQEVRDRIREAKAKGLGGLIMTDHYDKDMVNGTLRPEITPVGAPPLEGEWSFDADRYFDVYGAVRDQEETPGFRILLGIELGYLDYRVDAYNAWIGQYPWDCVIGSAHALDRVDFTVDRSLYERPREEVYTLYLETLIRMTETMDYDICGHFDYVCRYAPYDDRQMRYDRMPEAIDRFLETLVRFDRCLEINTASFSQIKVAGKPLGPPDDRILTRYMELGGQKVCLSSDAHHEGRSALHFDTAADWLRGLGLGELTYYVGREARTTAL